MPLPKHNPVQIQGRSPEEIKAAETKKRKEASDKKAPPPVKQKKYYDIKLEATVPCLITYRILADDEQDALNQMKTKAPDSVRPNVSKKKDIKATVHDAGSSILRFTKTFRV